MTTDREQSCLASRRALLLWIAHVEKPEVKNLRDVELLRRAAAE